MILFAGHWKRKILSIGLETFKSESYNDEVVDLIEEKSVGADETRQKSAGAEEQESKEGADKSKVELTPDATKQQIDKSYLQKAGLRNKE